MKFAALLLVFGMPVASASGLVTPDTVSVRVQVEALPGLTFSRQVPTVVTLLTPWGTQAASLNSGALYPQDPQHYWASLNPVRLRVKVPAGTAAGRYPVRVKTTLYICDQNLHLCTIRPSETQGQLDLGAGSFGAAPLTLTLKVPKLSGF
ncbi:hypothetical protein [Deinococcus altitudinis]|uniref:hypothetical protein n=1 Tax=Deinococcus altitudinis TaxID=468914 RepID=UPI0038927170